MQPVFKLASAAVHKTVEASQKKKPRITKVICGPLKYVDNNDTVSKGFIWFHSRNETMKREVKLSFGTETTLISLSNWNLLS